MISYVSAQQDSLSRGCGVNPIDRLGLRIGGIFIVFFTSAVATLFPVLSKRVDRIQRRIPGFVFEFTKFCGSGIILSTALIHLLQPAADNALGPANLISAGGCVPDSWGQYPYAFALCLISLFATFIVELVSFRVGTQYLKRRGLNVNCPPAIALQALPQPSDPPAKDTINIDTEPTLPPVLSAQDVAWTDSSENEPAGAQLLGVIILEFGILFHSLIIGMTMTLSPPGQFETLLIVIVFHQMFEGLGLGTRLAFLRLPPSWSWGPIAGALAYAIITPLGMAIGLATQGSLSLSSGTALVVTGVLDAVSAGLLLYVATVELIAHELMFNPYYHTCSNKRLAFVLGSFAFGAGTMSMIGKWA